MAGEWIPMRLDLADDPAVLAVCSRTGLDAFAVIGRLHKLWCWANRHLKDGRAPGVTAAWVDQYVARKGFSEALCSPDAGWLVVDRAGITFPNFDNWNSKGAKKRLGDAAAKRLKRNGQTAPIVREMSGFEADKDRTRGEKRREENTPPNPPGGAEGGGEISPGPQKTGRGELVAALAKATGMDAAIPHNAEVLAAEADELMAGERPYTSAEVGFYANNHQRLCPHTSARGRERPLLSEVVKFIGIAREELDKRRANRARQEAARRSADEPIRELVGTLGVMPKL